MSNSWWSTSQIIYLDIVYIKHYLKVNKSRFVFQLNTVCLNHVLFCFFLRTNPLLCKQRQQTSVVTANKLLPFVQSRLELYNFICSPFPVSPPRYLDEGTHFREEANDWCSVFSHFLKAFLRQKSYDVEMLGFSFFMRLPLTSVQPSPQSDSVMQRSLRLF